ncbi:MAG: hypothetical protein FJ319_00800 [SAR202 cluster bacterium]|nr:hypothetical protein [SAR202 cluster bacterium]
MSASVPGLVTITATETASPPAWALLERKLISTMEDAARLAHKKYCNSAGLPYYVLDTDDVYESRSMRGLLYAMGGADDLLDIALKEWNAITRYYDDGIKHPDDQPTHPMYMAQLHNEWWNLAIPYNSDAFHEGEGSQFFYDFAMASPNNAEMYRRAKRFANMYIGDDPEAQNWGPKHKIIRSPMHGGSGPFLKNSFTTHKLIHVGGHTTGTLEFVREMLERGSMGNFSHRTGLGDKPGNKPLTTTLYPIVKDLDPLWFKDAKLRDTILQLFDDIALNGDDPANLGLTSLVTNAYLYTGEEKYRKWVLEYADVWLERLKKNGGIMPDNTGPTGKIGENRNGQWWGGIHGWNTGDKGGLDKIFISCAVAAENAVMLSGDVKYLDLLRLQVKYLLDRAKTDENGQLLVGARHGPDGWGAWQPMRLRELSYIYHVSMSKEDYDLICRLREGTRDMDWNAAPVEGDRRSGNSEFPRFQYYDGKNPDCPEKILAADYHVAFMQYDAMQHDTRDTAQIIEDNNWPPNPVVVKGLMEVTMGTPQTLYNGGLNRGTVRYFDTDRNRPGLPSDVAALVDKLGPDVVGIQLVNTNPTEARRLIVQSGVFGEHQFKSVSYNAAEVAFKDNNPKQRARAERTKVERSLPLDSKYAGVELPPGTSIRLDLGLKRFANRPSAAFPWHGGTVPQE